jgi:hypothetical protein
MHLVRTIFTLVVAASLAVLPAHLGAIGMSAGSGAVASQTADCASMGGTSCEGGQAMSAAAQDAVPMTDGCDRPGDHGPMLPGACSTYCNSMQTLPTTPDFTTLVVLIAEVAPAGDTVLNGISVSPEPHPPKLV